MDTVDQVGIEHREAAARAWPLDLTGGDELPELGAMPEELDRYIDETMAANAAVVLAKTQATAARAEARDLAEAVRQLQEEIELERSHREEADALLSAAEKDQALLERDRAVAEARAEEVRLQVEQERVERSVLLARIARLEAERDEAVASLGWWSRRRYLRTRPPMAVGPAPTMTPMLRSR